MKHTLHLSTPAQCMLQALTKPSQTAPRTILRRTSPSLQQKRYLQRPYVPRPPQNVRPPIRAPFDRLAQFTKDEAIESHQVQVKEVEVDGRATLSEPQILRHLLQDLDREEKVVVQLDKARDREIAIVQIYDRAELLQQVRDKEKAVKKQQADAKEKKPKQIEMNWAISGHDMDIKLKQLESFLEKGKKVEILLAAKRRGRKAELEEATDVLKKIRDRIAEVEAKEVKNMEGQILKQVTLTVQKRGSGG